MHTGTRTIDHRGTASGTDYLELANGMARPGVSEAMGRAFEATGGRLAHRLLAGMRGAEAAGGDMRGAQAAGTYCRPKGLVGIVRAHRTYFCERPRDIASDRAGCRIGHPLLLAAGRQDEARSVATRLLTLPGQWPEMMMRLADQGLIPMPRMALAQLFEKVSATAQLKRAPAV